MPAKSDKHLLEADWIVDWKRIYRNLQIQPKPLTKFRASNKPRAKLLVNCPCCSSQVYALEQKGLLSLQAQLEKGHHAIHLQNYGTSLPFEYTEFVFRWIQTPFPWRFWACDDCLASGRAELAQFETAFVLNSQTFAQVRPYFYFDQTIKCQTCQKDFVYTKGQQRWAHQIFVIEYNAELRNCLACRKKRNRQLWREKTLQATLTKARAEPTFDHLFKASQVLLENSDPRALEYLRRAKNIAPSLEQKALLEQQILELKT